MDYLHQTVNSDTLSEIFDLPESLRNTKVEVIIFPAYDKQTEQSSGKPAFGRLKQYADPSLIEREAHAWELAMMEKYADR
ncbi:MAG: hypothetical protein LBT23_06175 [Synergistaceae bacterium]|nr:hypothetical protein [Synergistaceae bacterium]